MDTNICFTNSYAFTQLLTIKNFISGKDSVSEGGFYSKMECEARYNLFNIENYLAFSGKLLAGLI